ncbi:MAG TPA: TonB-dependent receptor, partial [Arenibacter sp.]|nr:TonB-dependent receptor [Arenibacter sp.]
MIRSKAFSTLFFYLLTLNLAAQYKISGTVSDMDTDQKLPGVHVSLSSENGSFKRLAIGDREGKFIIDNLGTGSYRLVVSGIGYKNHREVVEIADRDRVFNIELSEEIQELKEVKIYGNRSGLEFDKLREVEDMAIFAGKKSELILPGNMTINAATNNARQLYSRIAGLNIYENDGAGLQLSIGGRGLDPNRTANFNVRQNGYDISADALGYPESYYTPPVEAIDRIQIVRGAASLQYGTQFGGLLNFILKKPLEDKPLEIVSRQTLGSYGFFNSFNSISGTRGKLSYYSFFQYKRGDGWRPNSDFNAYTAYANLRYQFSEKTSIGGQYTRMNYLAHQSGGLTDRQFVSDPRQSNRTRNWFDVNWNLFNLELQHIISDKSKISLQGFGLMASRGSLGFRPNRPETPDNNGPRDLIDGEFRNWGLESRFMQRYTLNSRPSVLLMGIRYYEGMNQSKQGEGGTGSDDDFTFTNPEETMLSDYRFPSRNMAFFAEDVFHLSPTLSVTPGFRFEHISTLAKGYYRNIVKDLAGNIMENRRIDESLKRPRSFILFGLG